MNFQIIFKKNMSNLDSLIHDLFKIINNSSKYLHEFDIVDLRPDESDYIFEENHLAVNKIHVKNLYPYLREKFLKRDQLKLTNFEREEISLLILLIHPQFSSVWSQRKQLVCDGLIEGEHEFRLNKLILNKNCKSELAYMHRRWLVKRLNINNIQIFIEEECELVFKLSKKIKSNYYCWSYLNWLFDHFKIQMVSTEFLINVLNSHQRNVLELSVSDYCVFHFRLNFFKLFVLETNLFENNDLSNLIKSEYEIFDDFLFRYPTYQTVWNYRKYFLKLIELLDESRKEFLFKNLSLHSIAFLDEHIDDVQNLCKAEDMKLLGADAESSCLLGYLVKREIILNNFVQKFYERNNNLDFKIVENYALLQLKFISKFLVYE